MVPLEKQRGQKGDFFQIIYSIQTTGRLSVCLPKGSKILLAGGWKQHYAQEVEKSRLYALAKKVLGVEEGDIHEPPLRRHRW